MTAAYRQKLLNWFCSVLIVCAGSVLMILISFYVDTSNTLSTRIDEDGGETISLFAENLIAYFIFLIPAAFWHFSDFMQKRELYNPFNRFISSYRLFIISFLAWISTFLFAATGHFTRNSCDDMPDAYFHSCAISFSPWLEVALFASSLAVFCICLAKLTATLFSVFHRAK